MYTISREGQRDVAVSVDSFKGRAGLYIRQLWASGKSSKSGIWIDIGHADDVLMAAESALAEYREAESARQAEKATRKATAKAAPPDPAAVTPDLQSVLEGLAATLAKLVPEEPAPAKSKNKGKSK